MKKVKVVTHKVKKNRLVEARRKWKKFGDCMGLPAGPDPNCTIISFDDVVVERKKKLDEEEAPEAKWDKISAFLLVTINVLIIDSDVPSYQLALLGLDLHLLKSTASGANMMVCRLCGAVGDHIFLKCPRRKVMSESDINSKGASPIPIFACGFNSIATEFIRMVNVLIFFTSSTTTLLACSQSA